MINRLTVAYIKNNNSLPPKISTSPNFCFWQWQGTRKIPYPVYTTEPTVKLIKGLQKKKPFKLFDLNALAELAPRSNYPANRLGVSFGFHNTNFTVLDIDHCIQRKDNVFVLSPYVQEILNGLEECYVEFSPSKTGLHVFMITNWYSNLRSTLPPTIEFPKITLEVFRKNKHRAVTMTGEQWPGFLKYKKPLFEQAISTDTLQTIYFKSTLKHKIKNHKIQIWGNVELTPDGEKEALGVLRSIECSVLYDIYLDILQEKGSKSPSEYDFQLCIFLYKFMGKNTSENLIAMAKFLLMKLRYRTKFDENPFYVERTVQNAYVYVINKKALGFYLSGGCKAIKNNSQLFHNVTGEKREKETSNFLKCSNAFFPFAYKPNKNCRPEVFTIVKNENNQVKVNVPYALNGFDYGVFMSILNQCKQQSTTADCAGTFCINIPAVAKQLRQQDGGSFRTRFYKSLEAFAATSIRYKVLVSEHKLVTGTSFIMNYEIIQWKTHHSLKIKLNELFVKILFQANKNYCIYDLNTEKRLNTVQRYLYGLITNSVAIGRYPKTFEVRKVLQKMYCFVGTDPNYRRKKQYLLENLYSLAGSGGLRIAISERKDKFIVTRDKPIIIKAKKKPILL